MTDILKNAKFGDIYRTKDGRKAIVINNAPQWVDRMRVLSIENDENAYYYCYNFDGSAIDVTGEDGMNIVGLWENKK